MNTQNQDITQKRKKKQKKYERETMYMDRRRNHRKGKRKTAQWWGNGSSKENGKDMMERAADTNQKRRQTIIDNEEAVQHEHRREVACTDKNIATTPTHRAIMERKTYKSEVQRGARLQGYWYPSITAQRHQESSQQTRAQTRLRQPIHTKATT
jgi:hypothetical protein